MKIQNGIPFVDTNIIPGRNAGIGSLLRDLQCSQDSDRAGNFLLGPEFAFIDVGVSRAKVSTTLKTLLAAEFRMDVHYVATELVEVVPYANVTLLGLRAEKIRRYLTGMISSNLSMVEVTDWHYVVDCKGKVSSVAYSYNLQGNEVWEAYFMGRTFMVAGERLEFSNPALDEMLAPDVAKIESMFEWKRNSCLSQPELPGDEYKIEKNPLEAGLTKFGIALQKTNVPQRIKDKQNVLFLGNVLNQYPPDEQATELDRIAGDLQEGDIIIVQMDDVGRSFIEVLQVKGRGDQKTREHLRWINTSKLEIHKPIPHLALWERIHLKPQLEGIVSRLVECIGRKVVPPELYKKNKIPVFQHFNQFFKTFFRALPVDETLRVAIREALRKLPFEGGLKGIPVFEDDVKDVYGGVLPLDSSPLISEEDFVYIKMEPAIVERTRLTDCA